MSEKPTAAELEHAANALERATYATRSLIDDGARMNIGSERQREVLEKHAATCSKVARWLRDQSLRE